ncbi:hypothetical protein ONE63_003626 [Megalurothrips usitatus]|uniref:BD-FAE-like domain-containing protein n=1 Tax=Megalurothrips usitatus TaxID=439358 RepID=A0AAV7X7I6_9NEOP|nr:hypothetical protein ONE63_003626 [Megalurothrips usitatus]
MPEKLVVDTHIQITSAESDRVRAAVPYRTHRYGEGPRETMDEFGVDSLPDDAPIFVYIHGGYWQHLSKDVSCYPVGPLYDAGIRVLVVGYDLAPHANMAQIVEEIKRAGSHVMALAEKLSSRGVWFSGFSAGGHLTGVLLTSGWMDSLPEPQSRLIKGFLPISGIFDLRPIVHTYINKPLQMNEEEAERHSPMSMNIHNNHDVKVVIIYGQNDSPAFHSQSRQFLEKNILLQKVCEKKMDAKCYEVPEVDHFNLVENLIQPDNVLTKKLISIIKRKIV